MIFRSGKANSPRGGLHFPKQSLAIFFLQIAPNRQRGLTGGQRFKIQAEQET